MEPETSYAYTLTVPYSLFTNWGFFESRGYLPGMPGDQITETPEEPLSFERPREVSLGLSESEAWEFSQACDDLGEGFGTCVADMSGILALLGSII